MSRPIPGIMCPRCRVANVRGPSPAAMEDDDFRVVCNVCLRRFTLNEARCTFLRENRSQNRYFPLAQS